MLRLLALLGLVTSISCAPGGAYVPRDGDIAFQESRSSQSLAIQIATGSRYSHMGIVFLRDGAPYVFEAVQPVKATPLSEWISRGKDSHFVVKRHQEADRLLTTDVLDRMMTIGEEMANRDYDLYFEWSDDRIYCSELVWKIYERGAEIEIGELQQLKDFDLSHPAIQQKIRERFGDALPLDEVVISPEAMFSASILETVYEK